MENTKLDEQAIAISSVDKLMKTDRFSMWLGIEVLEIKRGYSKIKMVIRPEMINGFGIAHGGITFSLADSAFAFACNSDGEVTVALDVSISFPKPVKDGDILTAEAIELNQTRKTGLYMINVLNQHNELVAVFKGTCFRTGKPLL